MKSLEKKKTWNEQLHQYLENNLDNPDFIVADLADLMHISERQLYRLIKDRKGVTPNEYLNHVRFSRAYEYLENRTFKTIRETARAVGFRDAVYFSKQFKTRFGILPSEI